MYCFDLIKPVVGPDTRVGGEDDAGRIRQVAASLGSQAVFQKQFRRLIDPRMIACVLTELLQKDQGIPVSSLTAVSMAQFVYDPFPQPSSFSIWIMATGPPLDAKKGRTCSTKVLSQPLIAASNAGSEQRKQLMLAAGLFTHLDQKQSVKLCP